MPSERLIATIAPASADDFDVGVGVLHELAGDLERVDRELAEVAQREVAGPEVVDDGPDPSRADGLERRDRRRRGLEQGGLGDLEDEARRIEPGLAEDGLDAVDEAELLDLAGRDVDADERLGRDAALGEPAGGLAAGLAEDPATDRQDRAGLLGDLDEPVGHDHAVLGVVPADERLDAGEARRCRAP